MGHDAEKDRIFPKLWRAGLNGKPTGILYIFLFLCRSAPLLPLAFFPASPALAAGFIVSPIKVEFPHGKSMASLNLTNTSGTPTLVQVEAFRWEQENGKDVLTPTEDIFPAPPIITVSPRKTQIIRIALRRPPGANTELCYRLFISEVPDESRKGPSAVGVALRLSLPVFLEPVAKKKEKFQWEAERAGEKRIKLTLVNKGNTHEQVGPLKIYDGNARKPVFDKTIGDYVLPGQARSWVLDLEGPVSSGLVSVEADMDARKTQTRLDLGRLRATAR